MKCYNEAELESEKGRSMIQSHRRTKGNWIETTTFRKWVCIQSQSDSK